MIRRFIGKYGDVKNSDDILKLLHGFGVDIIKEPFMIIGQSYAGLLARGFVNKYPELIRKIILLVTCMIPGVKKGNVEQLKAGKQCIHCFFSFFENILQVSIFVMQ